PTPAPPRLYTLSLHDALPISPLRHGWIRQSFLHWYFMLIHFQAALFCYWLCRDLKRSRAASLLSGLAFGLGGFVGTNNWPQMLRSEEHTSELQSLRHLVCRLL